VDRYTGKEVELVFQSTEEMLDKAQAALEAGPPPDFLFGLVVDAGLDEWAYEDRLVDVTDAVGPLASLFDADALEASTLFNGRTGKRRLYALPMARSTNHIHVWKEPLGAGRFHR
jgi:ABC-type glycerol-3-phosphate transport system substrate-binding protein